MENVSLITKKDIVIDMIRNHEITAASKLLSDIIQTEAKTAENLNLLGTCQYILGEFEQAEKCWQEVLKLWPQDKIAINNLARYNNQSFQFWRKRFYEAVNCLETKNYKKACKIFRKLLEENDGFICLYRLLGLALMADNERAQARKVWEQGLRLDSSNSALLKYLSLGQDKQFDWQQEIGSNLMDKPLFKSAKRVLLAGAVCTLILSLGSITTKIIDHNSNELADIPVSAAEVYFDKGGFTPPITDNAVDEYGVEESLVGLSANSPALFQIPANDRREEEYYYRAGYNAFLERDWPQAINNYSVVVAMDNGDYLNREALYYLARTYYLSRDYANAAYNYQLYMEKFPDSNYYDDSMFFLCCSYYKQGLGEKAAETFSTFSRIFPDSGYNTSKIKQEVEQRFN